MPDYFYSALSLFWLWAIAAIAMLIIEMGEENV